MRSAGIDVGATNAEATAVLAPRDPFSLAHWRRCVSELYAPVRVAATDRQAQVAADFRKARDQLFATHADSPISPARRAQFSGLRFYPFDPAYRVAGEIDRNVEASSFDVVLSADSALRYTRVGRVHFSLAGAAATLSIFWIEGYGGGLFLPFGDLANGQTTYGGGRYLYDTIKGADLGRLGEKIVLDFNYAYNPSCAYESAWDCPLASAENRLPFAVSAGELQFDG